MHTAHFCQFWERLFAFNVSWRRSLWFWALSSWRRLDSWVLETGERCDNTGERRNCFGHRGACGELLAFVSTFMCDKV